MFEKFADIVSLYKMEHALERAPKIIPAICTLHFAESIFPKCSGRMQAHRNVWLPYMIR